MRTGHKFDKLIEMDIIALRQIYNTLADCKKLLLEKLLKKIVVCNHLLANILPSGKITGITLNFAGFTSYGRQNTSDWSEELTKLFAGPNIGVLLGHAYLAVRNWNRGETYIAGKQGCELDDNYPVTMHTRHMLGEEEKIEGLIKLVNEPLKVVGELSAKAVRDEDDLPRALANVCD